jgi:hypothetical protein
VFKIALREPREEARISAGRVLLFTPGIGEFAFFFPPFAHV